MLTEMLYTVFPSPLGDLLLVGTQTHLTGLYMEPHDRVDPASGVWTRDDGRFVEEVAQLAAYFRGERTTFDLPLAPAGTPFQQRVWQALTEIPYGQTASYGEIAARLGQPTAARAVGLANGRNPLAIVIPCHRVIGSGGALVGYGWGVERKRWLLDLEAGVARKSSQSPLIEPALREPALR